LTLATFCHENASNDPQLRPALPFSVDLTQKGFFFFFLIEQLNFPRMARPIEKASIHLSLAEVTLKPAHKVLIEVDDNISLIVGDQLGILDQ
jgi:hypothetical protein